MASIDMTPPSLDFTGIRAGDRNLFSMTITEGGLPLNLTGKTLSMQVRAKITDTAIALTPVVSIVDAPTGKITIRFAGSDVRTLLGPASTWSGVHDLQIVTPPEDPITILEGKVTMVLDVTRP